MINLRLGSLILLASSAGCKDYIYNYYVDGQGGEAGAIATGGAATGGQGPTGGAGGAGEGGAEVGGQEPFLEGAPTPNSSLADLDLKVWDDGNRYWFAADPAQVERMNQKDVGGGNNGDIYQPGGSPESGSTYVNHLFVTTPSDPARTADFGKIEVRVIGQSTFRPWDAQSIPNLRLDMNEFTEGMSLDGREHVRFNNGLVGSIYRELIAFEIYRGMNYPAPRAAFAWVGSNVWGPDVEIPYTLAEPYKDDFCKSREDELGGMCTNLWEFVGDPMWTNWSDPGACQLSSCTTDRASQLSAALQSPPGPGFKAATADYIDWETMHKAQCLSWILWTGDDAFHNTNNVVVLEKADGKFILLPYSIDISAGQEWYQNTPLWGINSIAVGCQQDPECWADTMATCEATIDEFIALDPVGIVDSVQARLTAEGMLRGGDEDRYNQIRAWYENRINTLHDELTTYATPPCGDQYVACGPAGECIPVWDCTLDCDPGAVQCGAGCIPEGQCFECNWPFNWCDNSCKPFCN